MGCEFKFIRQYGDKNFYFEEVTNKPILFTA